MYIYYSFLSNHILFPRKELIAFIFLTEEEDQLLYILYSDARWNRNESSLLPARFILLFIQVKQLRSTMIRHIIRMRYRKREYEQHAVAHSPRESHSRKNYLVCFGKRSRVRVKVRTKPLYLLIFRTSINTSFFSFLFFSLVSSSRYAIGLFFYSCPEEVAESTSEKDLAPYAVNHPLYIYICYHSAKKCQGI